MPPTTTTPDETPLLSGRRQSDPNLLQEETMMNRLPPQPPQQEQSAGLSSSPDGDDAGPLRRSNSNTTEPRSNRTLAAGSFSTAMDDDGEDGLVRSVHLNNGGTYDKSFFEPADEEVVFTEDDSTDEDPIDIGGSNRPDPIMAMEFKDANEGEGEEEELLRSYHELLQDANASPNNRRESAVYTTEDDYEDREKAPVGLEEDDEVEYENVVYKQSVGRLLLSDQQLEFYRSEEALVTIPWSFVTKRQVTPPNYEPPMFRVKTKNEENYMFQLADQSMADQLRQDLKLFPNPAANTGKEQAVVASPAPAPFPQPLDTEAEDEDQVEYENVVYKQCVGRLLLTKQHLEFYHLEEALVTIPWSFVAKQQVTPPNFHTPMFRVKTKNEENYMFRLADQTMADQLRQDLKLFPNPAANTGQEQAVKSLEKQSASTSSFYGDNGEAEEGNISGGENGQDKNDTEAEDGDLESQRQKELERERDELLRQQEQEKKERRFRGWIFFTFCCSALVFLAVGGVSGYFIGKETTDSSSETTSDEDKAVAPMATPTIALTLAPTTMPQVELESPVSLPAVTNATEPPVTLAPTRRGIPPRFTPAPNNETQPTVGAQTRFPTVDDIAVDDETAAPNAGETTLAPTTAEESGETIVTPSPTIDEVVVEATQGPTAADAGETTQGPTAASDTLSPTADSATLAPSGGEVAAETLPPSGLDASTSPPTIDATTTFPPTITPLFLDLLRDVSSDGGTALDTPGTPQNLATLWMVNEDTVTDGLSEDKQIQRYALATLYYSTGGADVWGAQQRQAIDSGWLDISTDDCDWSYIVCNDNLEIVALDFIPPDAPPLAGTLPPEIGLMSALVQFVVSTGDAEEATTARQAAEEELLKTQLEMDSRQGSIIRQSDNGGMLSGTIPEEIGLLEVLETFQITNQALTGTLPRSISNATSLVTLDLTGNQLSGALPLTIGNLGQLRELRLGFNLLQSTLKKGLFNKEGGMSGSLSGLFLNNNLFRGDLPSEIGLLTNIEIGLYLEQNTFKGALPSELGELSQIKVFRVNNNAFGGAIPSELSNWFQIEEFQVQGTALSGEVPGEVCRAFSVFGTEAYADCDLLSCSCCTFCCAGDVCAEA